MVKEEMRENRKKKNNGVELIGVLNVGPTLSDRKNGGPPIIRKC